MWGVVRTAGVAAAVVVVVAGMGLMGASAASGSGTNLLPNGSFDSGSISGWGATSAKLSLATPGYGNSGGALQVAWTGSGSAYTVWASPRPAGNLAVGTQVVAGGEVMGVAGRKICVLLQEHGTAQTVQQCATATGSWQALGPLTLTDKGAGDSVGFMIRQYGAQSGDSFLADSLTVTDGATPTPTDTATATPTATATSTPTDTPTGTATPTPGNLLPNGSFDSGSISGWGATNAKLSLATPGYGNSAGALKVAWTGSGSAYTVWAKPKPVTSATAGEQLTANGYVEALAGRTLCLQLIEHSATGSTVLTAQSCTLGTGGWQPIGPATLTVKNTGDSVGYVIRQTKPQAGDWFEADTLSLTGPSSTPTPTPTPSPTGTGTGTAAAIWNMDETSGTVMTDSSGNANNGTIIGPVQLGQAGHVGTSYSFPGPSGQGYVDVPASASLSPSAFNGGAGAGSVDISFWINTTYVPASGDFDLVRDGVYPDNEYKTELQQNGQASCSFHGTSSGPQIQGGPDIADGTWHHIECVETPDSITLYIDGTQVATKTQAIGTVNTSSSDVTVGSHGAFDWYNGKLDDVTITFS